MTGTDLLMANCRRNVYSKFLPIDGDDTLVCYGNSVELYWLC